MNVNQTDRFGNLAITMNRQEASALASVLAGVCDITTDETVELLFDGLVDSGATTSYQIEVSLNENYDEDDDPFTYNIVLSDPEGDE